MSKQAEQERRTVLMMAGHGISETDIARVIGIPLATLRKWYPEELATGQVKANSQVAQSLFEKAIGNGSGAVTAAIFWLKCRARWVEPLPAEGYVGKKQQLEQAAKAVSEPSAGWVTDLESETRAN